MQRLGKLAAACAIGLAAVTGIAVAAYPEKTINYIIAFGPGGESDVSARLQEPFFKSLTGQTVAIQYKAGAGGAAAWSQINSAPGDGYTTIGTNLPHILLQPLQKADLRFTVGDGFTVSESHQYRFKVKAAKG